MAAIETIYCEKDLLDHPRVRTILQRFNKAQIIACEHYGEVFNPRGQNFRVQKEQPSLILAKKNNQRVLPAPAGYGIGSQCNYYFSHMLNCVYDCRYCFLQGMYRSAHYVLFINYEDFAAAIEEQTTQIADDAPYFFSGYDCDSLAFEPVTGFAEFFLPVFDRLPNSVLELRTKSTQVRSLLQRKALSNVVVAFSLAPQNVIDAVEHRAPSLEKRIEAMQKLAREGWLIGLRFDPMIYHSRYQETYSAMFDQIFSVIDERSIHSVSVGAFRLPTPFYKNIVKLYPDDKMLAGPLAENAGMVAYDSHIEQAMREFCVQQIARHVTREKIFECNYAG